jgi:hypothetical protein
MLTKLLSKLLSKREEFLASVKGKPKPKPYKRRKATMAERRSLSAAAGGRIDPSMKQPQEIAKEK